MKNNEIEDNGLIEDVFMPNEDESYSLRLCFAWLIFRLIFMIQTGQYNIHSIVCFLSHFHNGIGPYDHFASIPSFTICISWYWNWYLAIDKLEFVLCNKSSLHRFRPRVVVSSIKRWIHHGCRRNLSRMNVVRRNWIFHWIQYRIMHRISIVVVVMCLTHHCSGSLR